MDLAALAFRAAPHPPGAAIELSWTDPGDLAVWIVRRERRFPGRGRRGVVAVAANAGDLADGTVVYGAAPPEIDREEIREEHEGGRWIRTTRQYRLAGQPRDRELVRSVRLDVLSGQATVRVVDRAGVVPGAVYYYTAFAGPDRLYSRRTQASAPATPAARGELYRGLPAALRRLDTARAPLGTVPRADERKGQLERFLDVIDAHAAQLEGEAAVLRDLADPRRVDSRLLAAMAHQLGWRLKDYLDEQGQRTEIGHAAEFHRTVGTAPNVGAMVNRLTGWDTRVREFVRNVLLSWDESRVEQDRYCDGQYPHPAPAGSVDTTDPAAMFRLRTRAFEDRTGYSYDTGRDDRALYNRETVGIYVIPDVETESFVIEQEWRRLREIVAEFLPIQVRAVCVLQPGLAVEEPYETAARVGDLGWDTGRLEQAETYRPVPPDAGTDAMPGWIALRANVVAHHSVDTAAAPVDTRYRGWHTGVMRGE